MFRYDRLDDLIKETGKKKNYLSQKIGHAGRYLNDAKKQNLNIKKRDVEILAEELGTTVEYLTGESDQKEKPLTVSDEGLSEAKLYLIEKIRKMDDETVAALNQIADQVLSLRGK